MTFGMLLYSLFVKPIELLYALLFCILNYVLKNNKGLSIIALGVVINLLVLPLYKKADSLQATENKKKESMDAMIRHIKKAFKGDERFMMLQTYYRQSDYKPIRVLLTTVPLLLQIPMFIAAYNFLSNLQTIKNVSFGPIRDLGKPDQVLILGTTGIIINILPVIMTLLNLVSSFIFTKNKPFKLKLQLYGLAVLFLVLLYDSPAGLVLYWTTNNVFSLIKSYVERVRSEKEPKIFGNQILQFEISLTKTRDSILVFVFCAIFLSLLVGCVIPSNVIRQSVAEFVSIGHMYNPLEYVAYSSILALGTFFVWLGVYFALFDNRMKEIFSLLMSMACGVALVDWLLFGNDLGLISKDLQYEKNVQFSVQQKMINVLAIIFVVSLVFFIYRWKRQIVHTAIIVAVLSFVVITVHNIVMIERDFGAVSKLDETGSNKAQFKLSTGGHNVMIIMLDRALGTQIPYIMMEKPELEKQFDGFTYYHNVVSFAKDTYRGSASVFGGYEYTPSKMNAREDRTLVEKQNEALSVLPVLFSDNGYDVSVLDPPFAGYTWIPDITIYDKYSHIDAYITEGRYNDTLELGDDESVAIRKRNIFCYSFMRISPLFAWKSIYNEGLYNENGYMNVQVAENNERARGLNSSFLSWYAVLNNMSNIANVVGDDSNHFLMMSNCTSHEPTLLQKPGYTPEIEVDNSEYDAKNPVNYTINSVTMNMNTAGQVQSYHVNMASMIQLGLFFDWMRENGVYDNTRIILVSDHGYALKQFDDIVGNDPADISSYIPLLMMKDFEAHGFNTSDSFMTNADGVPFAVKDLVDNPVNPFTGNLLDGHEKDEEEIRVIFNHEFVTDGQSNKFNSARWYTVSDNVYDPNNWKCLGEY